MRISKQLAEDLGAWYAAQWNHNMKGMPYDETQFDHIPRWLKVWEAWAACRACYQGVYIAEAEVRPQENGDMCFDCEWCGEEVRYNAALNAIEMTRPDARERANERFKKERKTLELQALDEERGQGLLF